MPATFELTRRFDAAPERVFDAARAAPPASVVTMLEIDRPRRLVYDCGGGRLTLDFAADGAGCRLRLTQTGLAPDADPSAEWRRVFDGWAVAAGARTAHRRCG